MSTETTKLGLTKATYGEFVGSWDQYERQDRDRLEDRLTTQYAGDPNGNVAGYWVGQRCTDTTNTDIYICSATGVAATASWITINSFISAIGDIDLLAALTAPAIDDLFAVWDTSASGNRAITFANAFGVYTAFTAMAASDIDLANDIIALYDASASAIRRGVPNHFASLSKLVQEVAAAEYTTWTNMTASDAIPDDDTIPQNTEGLQILTANITASATTNPIEYSIQGNCANNAGSARILITALFLGTASNAIDGSRRLISTGDASSFTLTGRFFATATTALAVALRIGSSGNNLYLNGNNIERKLGGIFSWKMVLREFRP